MKKPEIQSFPDQPAIHLKPIISYPRIAEPGEHYLLTIDLQLAENSPWPYPEEEFEISFILKTEPFFLHEPFAEDEPGLVLHRFGSTYGPAEYLLTASQQPVPPGKITITLLNGWGLPIAHLELECEIKQEAQENISTIRKTRKGQFASSFTSSSLAQPEAEATLHSAKEQRDLIAQQLSLVGWNVISIEDLDIFPSMDLSRPEDLLSGENISEVIAVPLGNIALRGYPSIENDYLLFIERKIIGYVKVYNQQKQLPDKRDVINIPDTTRRIDFTFKGRGPLKLLAGASTQHPFLYHTTFYETIFSQMPGSHSPRNVYTFHQPTTLATWLPQRSDVSQGDDNIHFHPPILYLPTLEQGSLFDYQFAAIQKIEESLLSSSPSRTLIQMKTNTGKTHTAIHSIWRLLNYAHAKHILYIVDMPLAKQYALDAFSSFPIEPIPPPPYEPGVFTDSYKVRMIASEKLDPSVHVYIGLLEDLYNLYESGAQGERLPRPASRGDSTEPMSLVKDYCKALPIEYFDVIFLAESEYINYQMWQPVLDYFDTFYIGIADSLSESLLQFFNNNLVYPASRIIESEQNEQDIPSSSLIQQQVSNTIKNVRALLRTDKGLSDYTDQLTHLSWLLLLKYLDDFEETEAILNTSYTPIIEVGYRWRDLAQNLTGEALLDFSNNRLIPYLSSLRGENFRDMRILIGTIFHEAYNRCLSGSILREAIDMLNTINIHASDTLPALAYEYEQILQEAHFTSWDAGEYYTPRPIVRFMLDCLQPRLGESLLDPACGSAGFLIEAYERLNSQVLNPEQWRKLQDNLLGVEKQSLPFLLGAVNMLLHGIETPNIQKNNALATDIYLLRAGDDVDIIATNPPFSGREKGNTAYPFSSETGTSETDQLFLQYSMAALKRQGGRCAIVVANRVLSEEHTPASVMRRRLLTTFRLHTIVHLPDGVFAPYVGIPTNILFFEVGDHASYSAQNPCTKEVWYYEIPLPKGQKRFSEKLPIQDEDFDACRNWWNQRQENAHAWRISAEWLFAHDCNLDTKNPSHTAN